MENNQKRFFGNPLIGTWETEEGEYMSLTPRELEERQDEFDWRASDSNHPDLLFPYTKFMGIKMIYDTEV